MKLADLITLYIGHQRSLGMRFASEDKTLRAFCHAIGDLNVDEIEQWAVHAFIAGTGPITSYWHQKFKILRGLYRFAIERGHTDTSPLPTVIPKQPMPATPYIYSVNELRRMLTACEGLQYRGSPLQAVMFRTLLLMLYGTAMRVGEALSLTLADVDLPQQLATVRDGKFYKSRLVPIGPKLNVELDNYLQRRCALPLPEGESSAFFCTRTGHGISYRRVAKLFRRVRRAADIHREPSARYQPRIHDLRHTAAVHRVVAWYRADVDVQQRLLSLSTYLGHVDIASTQRYLSMTPELLGEASRRFEEYVGGQQ